MKDWLLSLVSVSAVSVLASLLIPSGDEKNRRLIEFGLALLVLLVLLQPLSFLGEFALPENMFSGLAGTEESIPPETWEEIGEGIARGVEKDIASRFRIPADCVRAILTPEIEENELKIAHLQLSFSGAGLTADLLAIEKYAEETYRTDCEVLTDGN